MADIFVSYARADKPRVAPLVAALEAQGWSVWWDPAITPGQEFDSLIRKELAAARAVIVVWTPASVDSRWVRGEARLGAERGILVPVRFDKAQLPIDALSLHTTDLDDWNEDSNATPFRDLCRAVRVLADGGRMDRGAEPAVASPAYAKPQGSLFKRFPPIQMAIAAAALVVLGGTGLFLLAGHREGARSAGEAADTGRANTASSGEIRSASAEAGVSLAVLPFVNMSDDKEQEYFSDGLSEELLNQLAQIKNLRVAGRTSSFAFKGKNEDLRGIARALGVNHLLEGSVRKAGDQLRITAQLINAADGSHLWSQSYDRELKDVFKVQEDIAKDVAGALSVTLGIGEASRPEGGTSNVEAYDRYLRANQLMHQLGRSQIQQATTLYREAVTLDPGFALAWYGLHGALAQTPVYLPEQSAEAATAMADAAQRVETLAPDAWWTKSIEAAALADDRKWGEALAAAKAAADAAPSSDIDAKFDYAVILGDVGQSSASVQQLERARLTDPLSLTVSGFLQLAYMSVRRWTDAEAEYQRSKGLSGDHARWSWFSVIRLWRQPNADPALIDAKFREYLALETYPLKVNTLVTGRLQDRAFVRQSLRNLISDPASQDVTGLTVLSFWADHYGDQDLVIEGLQRQFLQMRSPQAGVLWAAWELPVRADPRFKQIVRELKLVDYWRASGQWGDFCHPVGTDDFECR